MPIKKFKLIFVSDERASSDNCTDDSKKWRKVYENDGNGTPMNNSDIAELAEAIRNGAEVKVYTERYGLLTVQKATVHINEDGIMVSQTSELVVRILVDVYLATAMQTGTG